MLRQAVVPVLLLCLSNEVYSVQQKVQLSDSYLPVAMQVIAHLTDQMAFEVQDEMTPRPTAKPTTKKPITPTKPVVTPTKPAATSKPPVYTTKPPVYTTKPTVTFKPITWPPPLPTTSRPYVTQKPSWWWNKVPVKRTEFTTQFHQPGLFAPFAPPKPSDRFSWQNHFLLPLQPNSQYSILKPHESQFGEPLLSIQQEEFNPLMDYGPRPASWLPPLDGKASRRSDGYNFDDATEEQLQYLSEDVREMIKMARNPLDHRVVDVWEGVRQGPEPATSKAKLSSTNLRLLLLYDLLSRDAKRQRLSDYGGFSPDVMKALVASSSTSAREQLKMALSKMVDRHDCGHDYANNRAKELVQELGKDESPVSAELRNFQPLIYKY